ncbi:MAG: MMPL family transporter [Chlorobi bacterium]|nr:MMPL family transporter [Chlorobiota bacterium]
MSNFFLFLYRLINRNKLAGVVVLLAVIGLAVYFASRLRLSEDITKVLPQNQKITNLNFVYSNAKLLDKVVFNISLDDTTQPARPELLAHFAERFTDSLQKNFVPRYIKSIDRPPTDEQLMDMYQVVYDHLPLFLDDTDYKKINSLLNEQSIRNILEGNYNTLISPMGLGTKKMIAEDPLHLTPLALNKFKTFQLSNNLKLFNGQFVTKDGKNLLVLITPASTNNTAANKVLFDGIDHLINRLVTDEFSGIHVEYFGSPVVALGNAERIKKDIIITVSLAAVLLILFISLFFKSKRTFVLVFLPVLFGGLVSLAALYLLEDKVSAISLGIGSVLLGISLDYALHILAHYRRHRNIQQIFKDLTSPILLSSLTTAGAFLSLHFINSKALNDLGIFAAIAVLSAALFSLLVLPFLLDKKQKPDYRPNPGWIDRIAAYDFSGNKYLFSGVLVLTIVFIFFSGKVTFDADMMKNNYMSDKLIRAEKNLNKLTSVSKKTIYLVTPGKTLDDALRQNEIKTAPVIDSLKKSGIIDDATVVSGIFHSQERRRQAIEKWYRFWEKRKVKTKRLLLNTGKEFGFNEKAFTGFFSLLDKKFEAVPPGKLPVVDKLYLDNFTIVTDTLAAVINVIKVNSDPQSLERAYHALENEPGFWLIDKRIITSEFVTILKDNLNKLVLISLSFVFVVLLLAYGRIELTIVTMIPVFFSWLWTVGIMGILGISFNIFNVIILTFVFGLGIDYSIFIMRGLLQEYKYGVKDISSYKVSVIISAITTLLGIGVLVFARHPALRSIATMSVIGILSVIFITFTILPAIFKWMVTYKMGKRNRPVTLLDLIFSLISLFIFVSEALMMSLFSLILQIVPGSRKKKKYLFHRVFSKLTWFLIYFNFLTPKKIINPDGEDFSKPAIIIANHQSHVDLMLMMLLSPKVLILTNRRNYTHPFYGKALQYADFLPSDIGYDQIAKDLESLIADGYSFMIFPEGHRNDDGTIRRFHKGAFYLADKLKIDILPIIIHGQNQCLKKSEFFLKRGLLTTKFLPRIDLSKNEYGKTAREQSRNINALFRKEYAAVRREKETPDYWADYIIKNFTYKGPVLEWYTRIKLKSENRYQFFNEIIPRKCIITDLGCGYGYLDFMLALVSEERIIRAYDYDKDKIAIAANCAIKTKQITFAVADITKMELESSDVFILYDVLHYLPKDEQVSLLERCIEKTNPGGMVIIRDSDKEMKKRHLGTRLTEIFSTGSGFNKAEHKLEFVSRSMIEEIAGRHNLKLEITDDTRLTSNVVYVLRKG